MAATSDDCQYVLKRIKACTTQGKTDAATDIPRGSRGQPGVVEWINRALAAGIPPREILDGGLLDAMQALGKRFAANEVFIPEVLIAARAMKAGIAALKPALAQVDFPTRGVFVIGTVRGDLHDIGKNLVAVFLEGAGWQVVDVGIDCPPARFVDAVATHPGCAVGLSALLTTTMLNMRETIAAIRAVRPGLCVLVGGAPVTAEFAAEMGATGFARDPAEAVILLDRLMPAGVRHGS